MASLSDADSRYAKSENLPPVLVQNNPLFAWASTWQKGPDIATCYGTIPANSVEEAKAYGLAQGQAANPEHAYISHGTQPVFDAPFPSLP